MNNNDDIQQVPIDQITILNPRSRNKRLFNTIVANIDHVGLKRPITITPRADGKYDLVCGQGRLEAYQALAAAFEDDFAALFQPHVQIRTSRI